MSFRFKLYIEHYETGKSLLCLNEVGRLMDEPTELLDALSVFIEEIDSNAIVKAWEAQNDLLKKI